MRVAASQLNGWPRFVFAKRKRGGGRNEVDRTEKERKGRGEGKKREKKEGKKGKEGRGRRNPRSCPSALLEQSSPDEK